MIYILMSTYNGAPFLAPQLQSILDQTIVNFILLIRDDGSTDDTPKILAEFAARDSRIQYQTEKNIGVIASFMSLILKVPQNARYIALCDQDDIWRKDKLEKAIAKINIFPQSMPCLYHGSARLIDEKNHVYGKYEKYIRKMCLENALVENVVTGCTVIFNAALLQCVRPIPADIKNILMHDWWLYLVAAAFGEMIYDDEALIDYRQHSGNVVGRKNLIARYWQKIRDAWIKKHVHERVRFGRVFLNHYENRLSKEQKKLLRNFVKYTELSFWGRLLYSVKSPCFQQRKFNSCLLKILLIFNYV